MDEITVKALIENIPAVTEWVDTKLEETGCPMKAQMQIDIALDEILSNIANYAYDGEPGDMTVNIEYIGNGTSENGASAKNTENAENTERIENAEALPTVSITFKDSGKPYNPLEADTPDVTLGAEERGIGGLGIYMVRQTMDEVNYRYEGGFNILTIRKNFF